MWLADAATMITPALRSVITTLHPDLARIAAYHKGWVDADGIPTNGSPGKMLRPALALWSASAVGAPPQTGLPAAVAIELVHDFSVLHDDIMDNDRIRRGRPAAWTVFGTGPTVLCGDALLVLANTALLGAHQHGRDAVAHLNPAVIDLCQGQAMDLEYARRDDIDVQHYLGMVQRKTGALLRAAATLGAVLAGAAAETVADLDQLGTHLGILFQITDDLLGLFGDTTLTGKPVGSDLLASKKILPLLAALESDTPAGRELVALLRADTPSHDRLDYITGLVEQAGGRDRAMTECTWHHRHCVAILDRLRLPREVDSQMRTMLDQLLTRHT